MNAPDPRIAYFVMSHTNVAQVERLVRHLRRGSPRSFVLVHHDAHEVALDRDAFASDPNVHVLERSIHGQWGEFGQVAVMLYGIEWLATANVDYDFVVLLSGQDLPVRPLATFERELAQSGDGLLFADPQPGRLLDRYVFDWFRLPPRFASPAAHRAFALLGRLNGRQPFVRFLSGRVGCRLGIARLRPYRGMRPYKGTTWWALSARAIAYVRAFAAANEAFVRHYRDRTIMPDESFFQTILLNAGGRFHFSNRDGRYVKWATRSSSSPETLRASDFDTIVASGEPFARKFDPRVDAAVIDAFVRYVEHDR